MSLSLSGHVTVTFITSEQFPVCTLIGKVVRCTLCEKEAGEVVSGPGWKLYVVCCVIIMTHPAMLMYLIEKNLFAIYLFPISHKSPARNFFGCSYLNT